MAPFQSKPDRDDVRRALQHAGPSTVTELMRSAGTERGARRTYRQVLRVMLREGTIVLDKKGRLSIPTVETEAPAGSRRVRGTSGKAGDRRTPVPERGGPTARAGDAGTEARPGAGAVARFEAHRDGFGFVNPTDGTRDVFIPPHKTGGALHGDLVEYQVLGVHPGGRRQGAVVRIARPSGQRVVGLVTRIAPVVEIVPFDARSGARFTLSGPLPPGIAEGVAVEIELPRSGAGRAGSAKLVEVLGPITQPGVDLEVLIRKHNLRVEFPADVLREANAIPKEVPASELKPREDFSKEMVVTIDGETAKDFDDAVSVTSSRRGGFELAVHIADVAHYIQPGSAMDIEARLRGTSVYFPGRAIPMLPPALSEDVCSLKPEVARLVQSVIMTFNDQGELAGVRFADGWIRSRARLTYGRVNALLKGAQASDAERPLLGMLERMKDLSALLASRRASRGGLDFDLPEPEVVLDALGAAADVRPAMRGPAQRLIEEFMIAANMAVAHALVERERPVLHRVHERPDPTKVDEFARVAASFGYEFPSGAEETEPADFREFLDRIAGRREERTLGRLLLRTMALARYTQQPLGHFGLAAQDYLHFTSPIRRYPDLVAHRALRLMRQPGSGDGAGDAAQLRSGAPGAARQDRHTAAKGRARANKKGKRPARAQGGTERIAGEDLDLLGAECSRLERQAEAAEREALAWKRAEVLLGRLGEEMAGTISSVAVLGLFVELEEVYAEGLVPVSALPADRYLYDGVGLALRGEVSGRIYRTGQPVQVIIARVDRITQRVELALPGSPGGGVSSVSPRVAEYARDRAKRRVGAGSNRREKPAGSRRRRR